MTILKTAATVGIVKFVKYLRARENSPHFPSPATFLARGNFHSRLDVSCAQLYVKKLEITLGLAIGSGRVHQSSQSEVYCFCCNFPIDHYKFVLFIL